MQKENKIDIVEQGYKFGIYYEELDKVSPKARAFDLWEFSSNLNLSGISKQGVLAFLKKNGFYNRISPSGKSTLVQIKDRVIKYVTKTDIQLFVKQYVDNIREPLIIYRRKNTNESLQIEVAQFLNTFLNQTCNIINESFLINLDFDNRKALKDEKGIAYIAFRNVIVVISKDKIEYKQYSDFEDVLLFESQIINAYYTNEPNWKTCHFSEFVKNITNNDVTRKNAFKMMVGYLLHTYGDPAKSQAVILYDEELSDTPNGGTGKGLIGQAISNMSKGFVQLDGKGLNLESQFLFQRINEDTTVIFIDDVTRKFDIDRLNSILTEGISVEYKHLTQIHIPKDKMPKFLLASNNILSFEGTTRARRQFIFELSNHYSILQRQGINEPILHQHKKRFFSDEWKEEDWNGFYTLMIYCLKYYLTNGLNNPAELNFKKNFAVQKIGLEIFNMFESQDFKVGSTYSTKVIHDLLTSNELIDETIKSRGTTDKLKLYLSSKGFQHTPPKQSLIKIISKI